MDEKKIEELRQLMLRQGLISERVTQDVFISTLNDPAKREEVRELLFNRNLISDKVTSEVFTETLGIGKGKLSKEELTEMEPEVEGFWAGVSAAARRGWHQGANVNETLEILIRDNNIGVENLDEWIKHVEEGRKIPQSKAMREFQEAEGFKDSFKAFMKNPIDLMGEIVVESGTALIRGGGHYIATGAASSAAAAAPAAALTGPLAGLVELGATTYGTAIGIGLASASLETASMFQEELETEIHKRGKEFNAESVREILSDPEAMARIRKRSITKGAVVGGVDAITGALTTKFVEGAVVKKALSKGQKAKVAGKGFALEGSGGFFGEIGSQLAIGDDPDFKAGFLEVIGEVPGGGANIAMSFRNAAKKNQGEYTGETTTRLVEDGPETPDDPDAPTSPEEENAKIFKQAAETPTPEEETGEVTTEATPEESISEEPVTEEVTTEEPIIEEPVTEETTTETTSATSTEDTQTSEFKHTIGNRTYTKRGDEFIEVKKDGTPAKRGVPTKYQEELNQQYTKFEQESQKAEAQQETNAEPQRADEVQPQTNETVVEETAETRTNVEQEPIVGEHGQTEINFNPPPPPQTPETNTVPETGKPITFNYNKNPEKAPDMGSTYGQDKEPAGNYVTQNEGFTPEGFETGTATLENPLVIDVTDDTLVQWKGELSEKYGGKTGKNLTDALKKDGYDGIVTRHPDGKTGEIILFDDTSIQETSPTKGKSPVASGIATETEPVSSETNAQAEGVEGETTPTFTPEESKEIKALDEEIESHEMAIEDANEEIGNAKSNYTEDVKKVKEKMAVIRKDKTLTKEQKEDAIEDAKAEIEDLKDERDAYIEGQKDEIRQSKKDVNAAKRKKKKIEDKAKKAQESRESKKPKESKETKTKKETEESKKKESEKEEPKKSKKTPPPPPPKEKKKTEKKGPSETFKPKNATFNDIWENVLDKTKMLFSKRKVDDVIRDAMAQGYMAEGEFSADGQYRETSFEKELDLANKVNAGGYNPTDTEVLALGYAAKRLSNSVTRIRDHIKVLKKASNPNKKQIKVFEQTLELHLSMLDAITFAGRMSGLQAGRALGIRGKLFSYDKYSEGEIRATYKRAKGGKPLTAKENQEAASTAKKIAKLRREKEKLLERHNKLMDTYRNMSAEQFVKQQKNDPSKDTKSIDAARKNLDKNTKDKGDCP